MATNSLCEIRLLLHTSHAGGLIGKGGARITQLREVFYSSIVLISASLIFYVIFHLFFIKP